MFITSSSYAIRMYRTKRAWLLVQTRVLFTAWLLAQTGALVLLLVLADVLPSTASLGQRVTVTRTMGVWTGRNAVTLLVIRHRRRSERPCRLPQCRSDSVVHRRQVVLDRSRIPENKEKFMHMVLPPSVVTIKRPLQPPPPLLHLLPPQVRQ